MSICASCSGYKKNNNTPIETNNVNTIKMQPTFIKSFSEQKISENKKQPSNDISPKKLIQDVIVGGIEKKK